jgi:hypothetical protein
MGRYYFHLRQGKTLTDDDEGTDLPNLSAAQREAELAARELLAGAIKHGRRVVADALVVADERGGVVVTLPLETIIPRPFGLFEPTTEGVFNPMSTNEEYRRQAIYAEKQANSAGDHVDRETWLRIAQGWMSLLRTRPQRDEQAFNEQSEHKGTGQEDSESSH